MAEPGDFGAFVVARSETLLRTAYLLTGDRGAARDLLQTALVAVHRRWGRLDEDPTTAARRELVAAHTRRRFWLGDLLADSTLLAGLGGLPGFARRPPDPGPRDETTTALAGLPPRMRAVLVLRFGEGLLTADTAAVLGCDTGIVVSDTDRGLARLGSTGARLSRSLAERAGQVSADPADVLATALDGERTQRRHWTGLAALVGFLLLVAVLVVVTV